MTGGEIVPVAAKAVHSAAEKALDDAADKAVLQQLAVDSPNMKAAAESYARRVAIKEALLLRVYQPIAKYLGVSRDYFDTQFHEDLAEKVADIPEEHLTTPSPSVAIPAMQGLSYSIEEPDLKAMYLSLLATATDQRVAVDAHPSFAEVIKQLSPGEASLLLDTLRTGTLPAMRVNRKAAEGSGGTVEMNCLLPFLADDGSTPREQESLGIWVDNWVRLGLITVDYARSLVDEAAYAWAEGRPEVKRLASGDSRGMDSLDFEKGIVLATDFGRRFLSGLRTTAWPWKAHLGCHPGQLQRTGRRRKLPNLVHFEDTRRTVTQDVHIRVRSAANDAEGRLWRSGTGSAAQALSYPSSDSASR